MTDLSDEDATRMLATFRPSQHVKMVWRVADMSATSRVCVASVEFGERHDKRTS